MTYFRKIMYEFIFGNISNMADFKPVVLTLIRITMTGIKWRVYDNFSIFPPVVNKPADPAFGYPISQEYAFSYFNRCLILYSLEKTIETLVVGFF